MNQDSSILEQVLQDRAVQGTSHAYSKHAATE
jgi:hypothetical protein